MFIFLFQTNKAASYAFKVATDNARLGCGNTNLLRGISVQRKDIPMSASFHMTSQEL